MSVREINEAVARKLGFVKISVRDDLPQLWASSKTAPPFYLPDYCTSIAAAWEIMEKVKTISLVPTDKGWHASSGNCIDRMTGCLADTAPMAICLAFLKCP